MVEDELEIVEVLLAEDAGKPLCLIAIGIVIAETREVVGHVEEHLRLDFHRLDVAHIEEPIAVGASLVGLEQFLVHQHWSRGGEPKIVVGRAEITEVIIDAASSLAKAFVGVAHTLHIAVVVVRPDEGDVIGHTKACIVDVEGLLIRYEDLWNGCSLLSFIFFEYFALTGKNLFEGACTVAWIGAALHSLVVKSAHTHGVDVVVLCSFANAVVELAQNGLAVGLVVPFAIALLVPFEEGGVVEEQGFAMAGGDHDAPLVGHHLALGMTVEGTGDAVHGRCQHIALEAKDEFADAVVGLGSDVAQLLLVVARSPGEEAPVLVVDEKAAIADGGRRAEEVLDIVADGDLGIEHRNVGKPVPGAHANLFADVEHAVGKATGIRAGDAKVVASCLDGKALPCPTQGLGAACSISGSGKEDVLSLGFAGGYSGTNASDTLDVVGQRLRHLTDKGRILGVIHNRGLCEVDGPGDWGEGKEEDGKEEVTMGHWV